MFLPSSISLSLLTIAAGVRVGDSAESLSVGYVPSGDPFGSLNHPRIGQRKVGCQPVGLMVAFFLGTRLENVNSKACRMKWLVETSPTGRGS